jgi:transketolase
MNLGNQRMAYGKRLVELGKIDPRIVVLEADLGKSTMSCLFQQEFPNRYFEMGIAEADMVSFAAGLSLTGKIPFVNSFAVFAAGRPYDQIRQGICIGKLNVKIVGSSAGLSDFGDGATHQAVEDIAIMRAIPNMTVIVPCDAVETKKATDAIAAYDGPVYMRINRNDLPDIFPVDREFKIGKPAILKEGRDYIVLATGMMVGQALDAARKLKSDGISIKVANISTLKPVSDEEILKLCSGMKGVITAEEHSYIGGLASVVSYALRGKGIPMEVVAIDDSFGQSALSHEELLAHYRLTSHEIIAKVKLLSAAH